MAKPERSVTVRPWVLSLISVTVLVVWAINILAGLFVDQWDGDAGVNAVMLAIITLIGTVFGKSWLARPVPPTTADTTEPRTPKEGGDIEP